MGRMSGLWVYECHLDGRKAVVKMMENIFSMNNGVQLIMAFLGSAGFAMLFHLRKELMPVASFGGLFCWLVYLICEPVMRGYFFPSFVASACGAFYAEALARILKVPSTPLFVVAVVPLIPGSTLYYAMDQVVHGYLSLAGTYGLRTIQCALGIGGGMSVAWAACDLSRKLRCIRLQRRPTK